MGVIMQTKYTNVQLAKQLKCFANDKRLGIVSFLNQQSDQNVGQIADEIRLSFKSTSRHLRQLEKADIICARYDGNMRRYSLAHLDIITRFMIQLLK